MQLSQKGLDLLKKLEGFQSKVYHCSAGVKTIGYGHAIRQGETFDHDEVTIDQANRLLKDDVTWAERAVSRIFPHLSQNQFDALVLFVFNIGETQFVESNVCKYLKIRQVGTAISYWKQWNKVLHPKTKQLEVCKGLDNRRKKEIDLFSGDTASEKRTS
jgi:lysozyme